MELEDLIEEIDIVDYISQFVDLTEKNGEFWGLSPFSDERTPSFSVRRETNRFYCFSSGVGGNVFTFVKYYNKCTSKEAVDILKSYAGYDNENYVPRQKLSIEMTCKKYKPKVTKRKESTSKIFPKNYMEKYEKRKYKLVIWEEEGISPESLDKFQVYYDNFSNRLVYPIRNLSGDIVNIGGRTLDSDWKNKGLRKYTYFSSWGDMDVIYGLYENMKYILEQKEIIIFEGAKSVMLANSWGIKNTGAILTSHLNPSQMRLLVKLGVKVVFALDKDVNIRKDHNINRLKNYVNVDYLWDKYDLLDEKDAPVDKGLEVFKKIYGQKIRYY